MEELFTNLEDQLQYFETIVQYLDKSGNLSLIKEQCDKYKNSKGLVFIFKLLIDPIEVCEANAKLGNLLLKDPMSAGTIFQQVVYKTVQVLGLLQDNVCLSQVAVILRLSSLPVLPQLNTVETVGCLSRIHDAGVFCRLKGVVTGLSAVSKYTLSARYQCPDEDCEGNHGNHFIRIHTPSANEAQTVRQDFKCTFCDSVLKEEKSSRTLSDKAVAEVIPDSTISLHSHHDNKSRLQAIPVYVRDDLTKQVEIGETYEIIGMTRKDIHEDRITLTLEANNIRKVKREVSSKKLLKEIPRDVLKLYRDRKSSPWSFVLTLAYLFAGDVCPVGSYFSLKLAILLSLVSKMDTKTKPVHLLAIGADTEIISRLLQFGLKFLDNTTVLTADHSLTGHVIQDKYNTAQYFVEGGVLHLAQSGVCYIGDVNRHRKSTVQKLQSALSGSKVLTSVGSKFTGGLPYHIEQPLRARVWAYSDNCSSKRTARSAKAEEDVFVAYKTGPVPETLLESFSLACFTDTGDMTSSGVIEAQSIEMTLVSAMSDYQHSSQPITAQDMQLFIRFACQLRPRFTKEAETLIHSYYLTSRKSRSTNNGTDVPVNADQTMLSLAYSHAKLALQDSVTIHDALMAIKIYEEYLTVRFGYSTLSVQPIPHVTADFLDHCLGSSNDLQMHQFHKNLLRYCSLASGLEE